MDARRALRLGLLIAAAYMTARFFVYRAFPLFDASGGFLGWDAWFRRDALMSAPRLAGFAACLAVMARGGLWREWGWHGGWDAASARRCGVLLLGYGVLLALPGRGALYSPEQEALGWLTTLPVALFEEACFRGLLYLSLARLRGPRAAALLSSALFAAYHVQAQPLFEWPAIFCVGVTFCAALESGLGLPWLVLVHELADVLFFYIGDFGASPWWPLAKLANYLLFAGAAWRSYRALPSKP